MKIIHVIFCMQTGGSETMLVDILNEQAETSNSVGLLLINDDYNPELIGKINPKVKITKMGRRKGYNSLWVALKINLFLLRKTPDIIHFHDPNAINFVLNKRRYKTVMTSHNVGLDPKCWHKFDLRVAISDAVKLDIKDQTGLDSELVYNGVKLSTIRKRGKKENDYKIVQVGRLVKEKNGQDILLEALAVLQKKYPTLPLSLDIIGDGSSSEEMKKLAQDLELKRVTFFGLKDRAYIYEKLANYDLLVQPSRYEGFGLVIAEALAANIQVLVSNTKAALEVISQGKYGVSFKVGDVEDCAASIENILIKGNFKDQEGLNHYLSQNFDIKNTALRYISLYKKLLNN